MQLARPATRIRAWGRSLLVVVPLALAWASATGAAPAAPAAPADTLVHTVRDGDTLIRICSAYRDRTHHYALDDLLADIRHANGLTSNLLRIGRELRIPVLAVDPGEQVRRPVRDGAELRGIYLTGPMCGVSSMLDRVDAFIAAGGNAVVFDAKDIDGGVSFRSRHPLASWGKGRSSPVISSLDDMMARFRRRGLYTVARLALFLDGELGSRRPDLALQDAAGAAWGERDCVWMDPARPEVQEYNLALAVELARAGVDEIQFDYVRFPTNGWRGDWQGDLTATALRRRAVISGFLATARDTLARYGVRISADLFGIMAWDRMADLALTGQHVPTIAGLVDVICPMIYPSHFAPGFEGRARPADAPAEIIGEGTRRFVALAGGRAAIRPWLQAFAYRVTAYDGAYVAAQVHAARAAGGAGWCLWNPSGRYGEALAVLPELTGPGFVPAPAPAPVPVAAAPLAAPSPHGPARGLAQPIMPQAGVVGTLAPVQSDDIP